MKTKQIAIIGFGKIAQDQHVPSIAETEGLELVATVSKRHASPEGVPSFLDIASLSQSGIEIDAVALCTPPEDRSKLALECAACGWDVLLEKPPGESVDDVLQLAKQVASYDKILFTTWHSQYNAAVDAAALRLTGQKIAAMRIDWIEDVRKWHPGQDWIWTAGGFGVFDPGINALSIATKILPTRIEVEKSQLTIANNHESPIAVELDFGEGMSAFFDWRGSEEECWRITIETETETLVLDRGGSELWVDGDKIIGEAPREYRLIYARFAELLEDRKMHVDAEPLRLVEEARALGKIEHIPDWPI